MLRTILHRALSLLVASAVLLTSLPYVSFAHRHADADSAHSHSHQHGGTAHIHHHHGHSHHHHGDGTHAALNEQQLVHCHVYWWGFELTLPGSPQQPDQEPGLNQFVTYHVPPSIVAFVPDASLRLITEALTLDTGLESLVGPTSSAPIPTWQRQLPNRLSDSARRARSGVLLV